MSSINPYFTLEYSQPSEYHFSHDSVFMARQVFERVGRRVSPSWRVMDLCSGCGIIGLDFLFHLRTEGLTFPQAVDFVDVQDIYASHFALNRDRFFALRGFVALDKPLSSNEAWAPELNFRGANYSDLCGADYTGRYDLVLCNPPYFFKDSGKLSPSKFKNRCRFFLDSDLSTLVSAIANVLAPSGRAFVLSRADLSEMLSSAASGRSATEAATQSSAINPATTLATSGRLRIHSISDIRGTKLYELGRT